MIRKLSEQHNTQVMEFLGKEPSLNLFIIGDIESFGYNCGFQELWGDFSEEGRLRGVLLRFYNTYIPYGAGDYDVKGFLDIINQDPDIKGMSGKQEIILPYEEKVKDKLRKKQVTYFCECTSVTPETVIDHSIQIKKAGLYDVDSIIQLRSTIQEFTFNPNAKEMLMQGIETNTARTYFIEENGDMAACASTAAENSKSAMIVGVCTSEMHRNKGYASAIVKKLTADLLAEGKSVCLFYDNPNAGRIYKRIGFQDIGMWTMLR